MKADLGGQVVMEVPRSMGIETFDQYGVAVGHWSLKNRFGFW